MKEHDDAEISFPSSSCLFVGSSVAYRAVKGMTTTSTIKTGPVWTGLAKVHGGELLLRPGALRLGNPERVRLTGLGKSERVRLTGSGKSEDS